MLETKNAMAPQGELFMPPDVDGARAYFQNKSRAMVDKRMSVEDAVEGLIQDGDYVAIGGFGSVRIPTAVMHELVRQRKHGLGLAGHCSTHDFQILAAGGCIDRCDISYVVGLEMRGLSPNARRYVESGAVRMAEWSNAGLAWRYKAAAMGVPFCPPASCWARTRNAIALPKRSPARTPGKPCWLSRLCSLMWALSRTPG
jgi:glutaconate CoA-transferase, subunit A